MKNFMKFVKDHLIISALITGLFGIAICIIGPCVNDTMEIEITAYNENNIELSDVSLDIVGKENIHINIDKNNKRKVIKLKKGQYTITARKAGYEDTQAGFDFHQKQISIVMHPGNWQPLSLAGWSVWGNLNIESKDGKSIRVSSRGGEATEAGYNSVYIDKKLKGRMFKIVVNNASLSKFSDGRMLKVVYNKTDSLLNSTNMLGLVKGEYIPAGDQTIEYIIPENFDGKIGFVFYKANLKNLKISAFYK